MNQYEVMYVIDTTLEEQDRTEVINRFSAIVTANGGTVDRVDEWGKRRLAYAINYKTEGYYVLMYITAPSELPRELERNFQNADSILRYLVIRFEGAIPAKREPLKPFVPRDAATSAQSATPADAEPAAESAPEADTADEAPAVDTEAPVADAE